MILKEFNIGVYFNKGAVRKAESELSDAGDIEGSLLNRKILYFQNIIVNAGPAAIIESEDRILVGR